MKRYPIDESLGKLANFFPPFNRFVATMGKIFMPNVPFYLKRATVHFRSIRFKGQNPFNVYVVYPSGDTDQPRSCYLYLHGGASLIKPMGRRLLSF